MAGIKVGILGSGNIGTDLMYKILKNPQHMELVLMAGIEPGSDGLARARAEGIATSADSIEALLEAREIRIVFDATSAKAHQVHAPRLKAAGKIAVDLTPAAVGPYVVPPVNGEEHIEEDNINLISCGAQAAIPMIRAVSRVTPLEYAELITATASKSVGPGTRQNIDEFSFTTSTAIRLLGQARQGRALPVINPAVPEITMTNTMLMVTETDTPDLQAITESVHEMVAAVNEYVPGYRLKSDPILQKRDTPWGVKQVVIVLNEVEGAGDYLPKYAGNLDIITAAAWRVGNAFARNLLR